MIESARRVTDYEDKISSIRENMKSEMHRLKAELRRRSAPTMIYPAPPDNQYKLIFAGRKTQNS